MNQENAIIEMLRLLRKNGIYSTKRFEKDLVKLVKTNIKKFVENFSKDIRRRNLEEYNKSEMLGIDKKQKIRLDGNNLYRYEYREDSNLKCIYMVNNENNKRELILLCAFNEDGDKKKGQSSYNDNIDRAIRIYLSICGY